MKNLKAKLRRDGGFTLVEMLIVVAIIAILIAVSIPLVGSALDKAKQATDAANERAAKAEMTIVYLNNSAGMAVTGDVTYTKGKIYAYDAQSGKLVDSKPTVMYGQYIGHTGEFLSVTYDEAKHEVYMSWDYSLATTLTENGTDLCSKDLGTK